MVEIFTTGGGEYIVNVLNAVAAWTECRRIQEPDPGCPCHAGFALAVIVVAFKQNWRAWLNWFLGATLICMCLMVPRMDVQVTDRSSRASLRRPLPMSLGLALMASPARRGTI
ncbi:conjugal transfer protein TraG N-terminal domain-containing protein [Sphingopyxis sp.]|uniref:conjugal transfer protein TraG N-terminal domain-containing protein n=1 Tax=Sphingopyxis sp. TaxID=1908224 RepID=UPI0025DAD7B0|nr:conjugal transfer protein TraG N-terminal domain-containing protein [Sphingopyxis sp.]MBK6413964.1 conjugal transfer protein TraG N-terminal domain-containing protein [Sphingopyxis sp.]